MEETRDNRTRRLLGDDKFKLLQKASVLVVGVGGVGGYAAEMLARSGVGNLTIIDADDVAESNINRQLIATTATVGRPKVILFAERFHEINPDANITAVNDFLSPDNLPKIFGDHHFDFVIDAIDTVAPKVALIEHCLQNKVPVISSMGAGGRVDPTKVGYFDLWETREDGLAKAVRRKMKADGVRHSLRVVASTEKPCSHSLIEVEALNKRTSYGTIATIPALFGILLANHVIRHLAKV